MKARGATDFSANMRSVAGYLDLGLRFALAAALGGLLGYWLDSKLGITPLGIILGIMLGGTAGFISMYRTVMRLTREEAERKAQKGSGRKTGA